MSQPVPQSTVIGLLGPLLLGYFMSWGLFGVLAVQTYIYHSTFRHDSKALKITVYVVFLAECFLSALQTHAAWHSFVSGWGNPEALRIPVWTLNATPAVCGFISSMVQIFFCWRIMVLSDSRVLPLIISAVSLTQWILAFYAGIKLQLQNDLTKILDETPLITAWLGGSALCDVMITATMVSFLVNAARRNTFHSTETVLDKLIRLTMETGTMTSLGALLELLLFLVFKKNNAHFTFFFILGRLYSNSLLVTLNARSRLQKNAGNSLTSTLWSQGAQRQRGTKGIESGPMTVHITTATNTNTDELEMVNIPKTDPGNGFGEEWSHSTVSTGGTKLDSRAFA